MSDYLGSSGVKDIFGGGQFSNFPGKQYINQKSSDKVMNRKEEKNLFSPQQNKTTRKFFNTYFENGQGFYR